MSNVHSHILFSKLKGAKKMRKLIKILICIILIPCLILTACGDKEITSPSQSTATISVIKQSTEVDGIDKGELLEIIENSLKNNKSVLNTQLTMQELEKAKESGVAITVEYDPAKEMYVKGAEQELSVSKIILMMYDKGNYIVVSSTENGSVTMNIQPNIFDKIMSKV
jgi:hypothetical protein